MISARLPWRNVDSSWAKRSAENTAEHVQVYKHDFVSIFYANILYRLVSRDLGRMYLKR